MSAEPSSLFPAGQPLRLSAPEEAPGLEPRRVVVNEELGRPYRIELALTATLGRIAPELLLGKPIGIHLNRDGKSARHFHGLVSVLRFLGGSAQRTSYLASVRPWVWFLSRTQNCRIYQNLSLPEIIVSVFRD